jgi:hypothetical protein
MPKCDLPGAEPRGESICVGGAAMVNSKPPHKRLKLMRIMSEDNSVLSSLKRRKLFQDFVVMPEPTTFRLIPVLRSFRLSDFKLFKYDVNH